MDSDYAGTFEKFCAIATQKAKQQTMVALIIDSPWLPGYAGVSTLDFFFDTSVWLDTYKKVSADLAGAALVPGSWVEFGMAAEPSGWGVKVKWSKESPPGILHCPASISTLVEMEVPAPETDGLMPIVLN